VFVALIILLVFAVKTRNSIRRWGHHRILWEEVKVVNNGFSNGVGEWVSVCVCVCVCLASKGLPFKSLGSPRQFGVSMKIHIYLSNDLQHEYKI